MKAMKECCYGTRKGLREDTEICGRTLDGHEHRLHINVKLNDVVTRMPEHAEMMSFDWNVNAMLASSAAAIQTDGSRSLCHAVTGSEATL